MKKRADKLRLFLVIAICIQLLGICSAQADNQTSQAEDAFLMPEADSMPETDATTEISSTTEVSLAKGTSQVADASQMAAPVELNLDGLTPVTADQLADGTYDISVDCSSSMFKIVACTLTVQNQSMSACMQMSGTSYLYVYPGSGEEAAAADPTSYIPYVETADGAHTFTIPVEALNQPVLCAAFSKNKELWYDRTLVFRADSLDLSAFARQPYVTVQELSLADGYYTAEVVLEGGSGRASVQSPALLHVENGQVYAQIIWGSSHYDYMKVDQEQYDRINTEGNSVFEIPVAGFDFALPVVADTTAMGTPHEISYTLYFDSVSIRKAAEEELSEQAEEALSEQADEQLPDQTEVQLSEKAEEALSEQTDEQLPDQTEVQLSEKAEEALSEQADEEKKDSMHLSYAEQFSVSEEENGIRRITIGGTDTYLLIPEGIPVPDLTGQDVTVLQQPLDTVYLAASSAMDYYAALDELDQIRMTSTRESDWSIEDVRKRMENQKLLYAGKYSAPDYEQILSQGIDLAIESTMIYHSPQTMEQLQTLGIPVLVERSSYEPNPLGRMEWIKLYGLLAGKEKEAEVFFEQEARSLEELLSGELPAGEDAGELLAGEDAGELITEEGAGEFLAEELLPQKDTENLQTEEVSATISSPTAAFFYISSGGYAVVRRPGDYISRMINMAGGHYVPELADSVDSTHSTSNMEMEELYQTARDADVIFYNSTIDGSIQTIGELLAKAPQLSNFRAVQNGNVWCTEKNLFQQATRTAQIILEMRDILQGRAEDDALAFFHLVKQE